MRVHIKGVFRGNLLESIARTKGNTTMKKLVVATALFALTAGSAFAENPYAGRTDVFTSGPNAGQSITDQTVTSSVGHMARPAASDGVVDHIDPAANRYGDGAPYASR